MEKMHASVTHRPLPDRPRRSAKSAAIVAGCLLSLAYLGVDAFWPSFDLRSHHSQNTARKFPVDTGKSFYGQFPKPGDPFKFLPCTYRTVPPALNDTNAGRSWSDLFDSDPTHWSWGNSTSQKIVAADDPYAGRGIYLCGYLDVPLDYTNSSDPRIVRLAVTKYQVSGLAPESTQGLTANALPVASVKAALRGAKSERTIVIEPGGPGGSGTSFAWRASESVSERLSDGKYDVLGWDPRGVNISLPSISCFPFDADRDRWGLITGQFLEVSASPKAQLELVDAFNDATFRACKETHGDLPRFVTTAFVARDLEEIRKALGEDELTGYLVSYGTGIGQTYANMFPTSVGRMILDGTEYVRDHRELGGFGWTALDNATNAWHDGFLGECLNAGPEHCALARGNNSSPPTIDELEARLRTLIDSFITRPVSAFSKLSGPSIITYSEVVLNIYGALYSATSWPALAEMLFELENGNSTLAAAFIDRRWQYDPKATCSPDPIPPSSEELGTLVVCGDSYDAALPPGGDTIEFYEALWKNMTAKSWISGSSRFFDIFPCKNFAAYWPKPAEVYRGDLNKTLKNPVLLIAETYDPATPLRNGRRLLDEMGKNARLIVHHGYGHSSRDKSNCTDSLAKSFILQGKVPETQETACYANEKPYFYGVKPNAASIASPVNADPIQVWQQHLKELAILNPQLVH